MLMRWGRWIHRHCRLVMGLAVLFTVAAAVWGVGVFAALTSSSGFEVAGSESQRATEVETATLGRDSADVVVLYRSPNRTVDDAGFRADVSRVLEALPRDRVVRFDTYWSTSSPNLVSADRRATFAVVSLVGADERDRRENLDAIRDRFAVPGLSSAVGGQVPTQQLISSRVKKDIGLAEALAAPVLFLLMVVIFRSVVAALLPLAIGTVAIFGSFAALHGLTLLTDISVYSVNITTLLGIGLAIDYGLIMVVRFREELRVRETVEEAVARTVAVAGRTVLVSGLTVAVALCSLLLFPQTFLRSMGYGGVATVLVDMVAALTVLPALLALLGRRVDRGRVRLLDRRVSHDGQRWRRLGLSVMRRPVSYLVVTLGVLLLLGLPFLRISWGGIDARALPEGTETRVVSETLARDFPANSTSPITVLVTLPAPVTGAAQRAELSGYSTRLAALPGVDRVTTTGLADRTARLSVGFTPDRMSQQARDLVAEVRRVPPPPGAGVLVGGMTAQLVDQLDNMSAMLPWMGLTMAAATFVLLFLAFGSVVLPLKAMVVNVVSLSATFGVLVWIFQDGHLSDLLRFTPIGMIEPSMPVLILAIAFGLSMDYEVFLLSRVREHYERDGDPTGAVVDGLQRTGGVITSAALLFMVVVGAFATSGITFIKLTGVGLFVAVLVDATVVRALLVPAAMKLLGRAAWWAPGPLAGLHRRIGFREGDGGDEVPVRPAAEVVSSA